MNTCYQQIGTFLALELLDTRPLYSLKEQWGSEHHPFVFHSICVHDLENHDQKQNKIKEKLSKPNQSKQKILE